MPLSAAPPPESDLDVSVPRPKHGAGISSCLRKQSSLGAGRSTYCLLTTILGAAYRRHAECPISRWVYEVSRAHGLRTPAVRTSSVGRPDVLFDISFHSTNSGHCASRGIVTPGRSTIHEALTLALDHRFALVAPCPMQTRPMSCPLQSAN